MSGKFFLVCPETSPPPVANFSSKKFLDALLFGKCPSKPAPPPNFYKLPTPLLLSQWLHPKIWPNLDEHPSPHHHHSPSSHCYPFPHHYQFPHPH
jgi:hypothetical protein